LTPHSTTDSIEALLAVENPGIDGRVVITLCAITMFHTGCSITLPAPKDTAIDMSRTVELILTARGTTQAYRGTKARLFHVVDINTVGMVSRERELMVTFLTESKGTFGVYHIEVSPLAVGRASNERSFLVRAGEILTTTKATFQA